MKLLLCLLAALYSYAAAAQTRADSLLVVSWNVENFLDYRGDTTGRYTSGRFRAKCNAISKVLLLIAGRNGRLPDAVALMEVGNRYVLERLIYDTPLRKLDYGIVHYDSPDRRGIDCALLYRRSTMKLLDSGPRHLYDSSGSIMPTRDILVAEFDGITILVNHHPSKVGADSERRRAIAMSRMTALMDSLYAGRSVDSSRFNGDGSPVDGGISNGRGQPVLAVGDFNDDIWPHDGPRPAAEGTIKYNGAWEKIDGHFARGQIAVAETVFADPILSVPDTRYGGTKPHRSFSGPRWLGGVSDHYPIVLWLKL